MVLNSLQILDGYTQGVFPMAHEGEILWFDPDPRAVIPLDGFHVPRRLQRTLDQDRFRVTVDKAFGSVIEACAGNRAGDEGTWISPDIVAAYTQLHEIGFAHSVETWRQGALVGGLYGVALRGLFAGESMFSRERDASKVALAHLVLRLRQRGFALLDVQFITDHLRQFGAVEISRDEYRLQLAQALQVPARFA